MVFIAAEKDAATWHRLKALDAPTAATFLRGQAVMLDETESVAEAIDGIRKVTRQPTLIIIDTLARCMGGLDESSNRDASRAMNELQRFTREFPESALIILHHLSKGEASLRGASAILAAVDAEWRVTAKKSVRALEVVKSNNTCEGETLNFQLVPVPFGDGEIITAQPLDEAGTPSAPRQPSAKAMSLLALIDRPEITRAELLKRAREQGVVRGRTLPAKLPSSASFSTCWLRRTW